MASSVTGSKRPHANSLTKTDERLNSSANKSKQLQENDDDGDCDGLSDCLGDLMDEMEGI